MASTRSILVYDGDCGFCTTVASWVQQRVDDPNVVQPWQSLDLGSLGLTEADVKTAAWWIDLGEAGVIGRAKGSDAAAAAMRDIGGAWKIPGAILAWAPMRPVAQLGYRVIARYRYKLPGSTDACRLDP